MSQVYLAQIMLFGGNFAPKGFALCTGQIVPIQQNTALFSILGVNYGGNGTTTFGLPNLQGAVAVGAGQGPGLTDYAVGETVGVPTVTLSQGEMPVHNHSLVASTTNGVTTDGGNSVLATAQGGTKGASYNANFYSPNAAMATTALAPSEISVSGNNFPHNNMQPYLSISMCIALSGVFPPRG